ncbi:MAG: ABC transporter substrate-binding protein [Desulfobacteraceae bacterium]|nr:ABC transporter substrate-binding protein [Desulfobacteraceae bacterium]
MERIKKQEKWARPRGLAELLWVILFLGLSFYPVHAGPAPDPSCLIIGVGRDFYEGRGSRTFLHGSTGAWEALTRLDEKLGAEPWLATSWESREGGRVWSFRLRDGVRFHDGSPFTAREAALSVQRILDNPRFDPGGNLGEVVSVTPRGRLELVFQLERPVPTFPKRVAYYSSPMIKPDCFDGKGGLTSFIATGPFKLNKALPGREVRLDAFNGYWGARPSYEKVIFKTIPDARTRVAALKAGAIDAVADVGGILPEQIADLKSDPGIRVDQVEVATTHVLLFNCGVPPFDRPGARRWLAGALDRETVVDLFARGGGVVAGSPYTRLGRNMAFGLIQPARSPMPDFSGEKEVVLILHGGTLGRWPYLSIAQVVVDLLRQAGLSARIEIREPGSFQEAVKSRKYHLAIQPYTLMSGDPDFFYSYFIAGEAARNLGWVHSEADRLIPAARYEMDEIKRASIYRRLETLMADYLPLLPLYHDKPYYAFQNRVADFTMDHMFRPGLIRARPAGDELPKERL